MRYYHLPFVRTVVNEQLIQEGSGKLSSVPSGGGGGARPAAAGAGGAAAAEEEAPVEEEKEEPAEESDEDVYCTAIPFANVQMGFGLFDQNWDRYLSTQLILMESSLYFFVPSDYHLRLQRLYAETNHQNLKPVYYTQLENVV